jgi:hypothetical protein
MDSSVRGVRECRVIRELRVAVPSERTGIIGKNHREDQACLEKRSGQPHIGLVPAEAELSSYQR